VFDTGGVREASVSGARVRAVLLLSVMVGSITLAVGSGANARSLRRQVGVTEAAASESYWTPERMERATPADPRPPGGPAPDPVGRAALRDAIVFHGVPTIGPLFFRNGSGDHYCTASVIDSKKRNLLITAAHCIHGGRGKGYASHVAFVPKYDGGHRPYGVWTAKLLVVKWGWVHGSDPDLDVGFVAVNARNGHKIANVVGSNRLAINKGVGRTVNVAGYPAGTQHPIYCRGTAKKQAKRQLRFDCAGFTGGTSGSPWLLWYDSTTKTGYTNGVIGGYQRGGTYSSISYSPYFDTGVGKLRDDADKAA
jgi:V8-like Glu-specific endopeptidase